MLRTTTEVVEAARLGDPCTEEELRLCIVSLWNTLLLTRRFHLHLSLNVDIPWSIRTQARDFWDHLKAKYWHLPLDQTVETNQHPEHLKAVRRSQRLAASLEEILTHPSEKEDETT